jgi:F-box and leucine-rich repeat protein 2/20
MWNSVMLLPALFPKELDFYVSIDKEDILLEHLKEQPQDMTLFFECASADETWSENNSDFMRKIISWYTQQLFLDRLDLDFAKRAASSIYKHYYILFPLVPLNIKIVVENATIVVSSFLLGAYSSFFQDLIRRECRDHNKDTIILKNVSEKTFLVTWEFLKTGDVSTLWRKEQTEILQVLRQATSWNIVGLISLCQEIYKRYLHRANVFDILKMSHDENWRLLKNASIDFINEMHPEIRFYLLEENKFIGFEFFEFSDDAMQIFDNFKDIITHLTFSRSLTEDQIFIKVIKQCSHLQSIDLTFSNNYTDNILEIPSHLYELNLSACRWLTNVTLKKILTTCPNVKSLYLCKNNLIGSQGWAELQKLSNLKLLDLSSCNQIGDEEFTLILKSCRGVADLIVEDCKKISDSGFVEITKYALRLVYLSLSRCSISDRVLTDISLKCKELKSLNLTRCLNITEKGVYEAVKNAPRLRELNLTYCRISESTIKAIKKINPFLAIVQNANN